MIDICTCICTVGGNADYKQNMQDDHSFINTMHRKIANDAS